MSATVESIVRELDGLAFAFRRLLEFARLDDGGMQVKIMRHDGRADDADGDVEHVWIVSEFPGWEQTRAACRTGSGLEKNSSAAKQPPMVAMSVMTSASM